MLFNSLEFAFFFPAVVAIYFLLPFKFRTPLLLLSSCAFYMAFIPAYILILFVTILIDYWAGIYIERNVGRTRRVLLIVSIIATCLVLFIFKYFWFFTESFKSLAGFIGWQFSNPTLNIILPIGLSFHTFQSLSYVIEVYRGKQKAETNFITYATYVMFFPQLVAGPIERPQHLLNQFYEKHSFDYDRITSGLKRMAWGFFKKLVVADRLALYVNDVYASPQGCNGLQLSLATVFFAYQIYCDFSGYSDIAIGSARVLGFRLMENFNTPYYAASTSEFWQRWHISLSTWFRDYVYIPLGGSRVGRVRHNVNLLVTFGVSGLWHGANWTFVAWGLLNGVYLAIGNMTKRVRLGALSSLGLGEGGAPGRCLQIATTFLLTCFAWVLFRAASLDDAAYIYTHWFRNWSFEEIRTEQFPLRQLPIAFAGILTLELVQLIHRRISLVRLMQKVPQATRWAAYIAFILGMGMFGVYRKTQFIYFQF